MVFIDKVLPNIKHHRKLLKKTLTATSLTAGLLFAAIIPIYVATKEVPQPQEPPAHASSVSSDFMTVDLKPVDKLYASPGERRTVIAKSFSAIISVPFPKTLYGLENVAGEQTALVKPSNGLPLAVEMFIPLNTNPGVYTLTVGDKNLPIEIVQIPYQHVEATFSLNKQYRDLGVPIYAWLTDRQLSVYTPYPEVGLWPSNPFVKWDNGPVFSQSAIIAAKKTPSFQLIRYGEYFYLTNPSAISINGKSQDRMTLAELTSGMQTAKQKLAEYGIRNTYIFFDEPPHSPQGGLTPTLEARIIKMANASVNAGFELRVATASPSSYQFWRNKLPNQTNYYMSAKTPESDVPQGVSMMYNMSGKAVVQNLSAPSPLPSVWASAGQIMYRKKAAKYLEWSLAYWNKTTQPDLITKVWNRPLQKNDLFMPPRPTDGNIAIPTVHMIALTESLQDIAWLKKLESDFGRTLASELSTNENTNSMRRAIAQKYQTPSTHLECQNEMCVQINGAGANLCNNNTDCQTPTTHLECRNEQCVQVNGPGASLCSTDLQCKRIDLRYPKIWATLHDTVIPSDKTPLLKNFDLVSMMPENGTLAEQLQNLNQRQTQLAFAPIWYEHCVEGNPSNLRCLHKKMISDNNWYLRNSQGTIIQWIGPTNLNVIDLRKQEYPSTIANFWTDSLNTAFDGIQGDYPGNIEFYVETPAEYGIAYSRSMFATFGLMKSKRRLIVMGNASSEPQDMQTYESTFLSSRTVDIFMFEDFPFIKDVSTHTGKWGYAAPDRSGFRSSWQEGMHLILLAKNKGQETAFITNTLSSNDPQYHRFGLATALISGSYYAHQRTLHELNWYDEYAVDTSGKTVSPTNADILNFTKWLGLPLEDATSTRSSNVTITALANSNDWTSLATHGWRRKFENGIALVNPTASTITISLDEPYKRLLGNAAYGNTGEEVSTSVTIPANDGLILVKR